MNRYRNAPTLRGPTKASANTLCQKCLKRDMPPLSQDNPPKPLMLTGFVRHYSYECKATAQDRPYTSRPSRTQQLQNPRLMPKLSTENPNHLLESNGAADAILAKRQEDRGRKADADGASPRRERSVSSHSANSVSTISTNRSASASPDRRGSPSRGARGGSSHSATRASRSRKRRYSDAAESYSGSSYISESRPRSRSREWADERNTRRRRRESSPDERGRHRTSDGHRIRNRRTSSVEKSRITKERRSMTPTEGPDDSERRAYRARDSPSHPQGRARPVQRGRPEPPRERSLSPYSKRLALTQSIGH